MGSFMYLNVILNPTKEHLQLSLQDFGESGIIRKLRINKRIETTLLNPMAHGIFVGGITKKH